MSDQAQLDELHRMMEASKRSLRNEGATAERARIVAWLRARRGDILMFGGADIAPTTALALLHTADLIEIGEHEK